MKIHLHGHVTGTGVATYSENLGRELRRFGCEVVLTTPRKREWIVAGRRVGGFVTQKWTTTYRRREPDAEVMHSASNWVYALAADSVMIHDLNPLRLQGWQSSAAMFERQKRRLRRSTILTPSESVRQAVAFWLRVDPDTITVAPNGVDADKYRPSGERGGYVLAVGDYRYYKRVEDAVRIADQNDWSLVRVGPPANDAYGLGVEAMGRAVLGDRFQDLGYVDLEQLPALYASAEALVFTSRYEGFGIPPLEAAACGTPSILADTPVNREIHGDLACYLNGTLDVRGAVEALQQQGATLRANARRFTWERSARQHLKAWRSACE